MKTITTIFLIFYIVVVKGQTPETYIGAVVDYAAKYDIGATPQANIKSNLDELEKFITEAHNKNADIIVLPECGITSINLPGTHESILPYTTIIPDPKIKLVNPCNESKNDQHSVPWSEALKRLSCAAQQNKIYVVANLPERYDENENDVADKEEKKYIYNTNVVFNRNGDLIARYRKFNLFVEPGFNITPEPELVTFTTDFGVTFGTFICFDILFPSPALELLRKYENVTDIVYSTAWFSEVPFLTAIQTQAGWARAYGVNLLASGYNNVSRQLGGSGIYPVSGISNYIMPSSHESTLIINDKIPKIKKRQINIESKTTLNALKKPSTTEHLETLTDTINLYKNELIKTNITDEELCYDKFCCNFNLKINNYDDNSVFKYRMVVYQGPRTYGTITHDIQICAITACTDDSIKSCGIRSTLENVPINFDLIHIRGESFINNDNSVFLPTIVRNNLSTTYDYTYKSIDNGQYKTIDLKSIQNEGSILGYGIYGTTKNNADNNHIFVPMILFTLFTIFIGNRILNIY